MVVAIVLGLSVAQTPTGTRSDVYVVKKGDVLYTLEGNYSGKPNQWRRLVDANPFLKNPGRIWVDGKGRTIALIRPGEKLRGLGELGIIPQPLPLDRLKVEAPAPIVPAPMPKADHSWLWWLVLALCALLIFAAFLASLVAFRIQNNREINRRRQEIEQQRRRIEEQAAADVQRERELGQNPITSGQPFVPGGIPATEPNRIADHFAQQAAQRYSERHPGIDPATVRPIRVGPIEEGLISGEGMVGYLDRARPRRINPPVPGYQARFRFPDGTEEVMQSLVGCMNPVYYGEGMRGFTFTPGRVIVPAPVVAQPAQVQRSATANATPMQPQPEPANVVPGTKGEKFFTFRPAGKGRPNFVEFQGFTSFEVDTKNGRTQVRFD